MKQAIRVAAAPTFMDEPRSSDVMLLPGAGLSL
jgi:hypothetical protein